MDDAIYVNDEVILSDNVRKSGNRDSNKRGFTPQPGAAPSVSRKFQVLLAVLCVTLICSLCVLGTIGVLYASKSNQFESLKTQYSNLSERPTAEVQSRKACACPEGWVFHGWKCYFISTDKMNWNVSRDQCVSMGGHLVIINSQKEQDFLVSTIGDDLNHWIGLSDLETEGRWLWVDNTPLSQTGVEFWYRLHGRVPQPDNWKGYDTSGEHCAGIDKKWGNMWFDGSCGYLKRFVCESVSANQDNVTCNKKLS